MLTFPKDKNKYFNCHRVFFFKRKEPLLLNDISFTIWRTCIIDKKKLFVDFTL